MRTMHRPSASGILPDLRAGLYSWYFVLQSIAAISRADGRGHRASVTAMSLNFKRISVSFNTTKLSEHPP